MFFIASACAFFNGFVWGAARGHEKRGTGKKGQSSCSLLFFFFFSPLLPAPSAPRGSGSPRPAASPRSARGSSWPSRPALPGWPPGSSPPSSRGPFSFFFLFFGSFFFFEGDAPIERKNGKRGPLMFALGFLGSVQGFRFKAPCPSERRACSILAHAGREENKRARGREKAKGKTAEECFDGFLCLPASVSRRE